MDLNALFLETYITEDDIARIAGWGLELIRLPFHFKHIESAPYQYSDAGIVLLKKVLAWAEKYKLKVVLDLHAACGAQNEDWHADSTGRAFLWDDEELRNRTYALWRHIAKECQGEPALYGYDVLNEPVLGTVSLDVLKEFYRKTIDAIRSEDTDHVIFLEGHNWSQDIDFLSDIVGENIAVSIHAYQPIDFVFNFRRGFVYPGEINAEYWDIDKIREYLLPYKQFKEKYGVELLVGECGINFRNNAYGEVDYMRDMMHVFNEYDFHWTYWTYKCIAQGVHPDGVMQYEHNPSWIRRGGPEYGFETLYTEWGTHKKDIVESWKTKHFTENKHIVNIFTKL